MLLLHPSPTLAKLLRSQVCCSLGWMPADGTGPIHVLHTERPALMFEQLTWCSCLSGLPAAPALAASQLPGCTDGCTDCR